MYIGGIMKQFYCSYLIQEKLKAREKNYLILRSWRGAIYTSDPAAFLRDYQEELMILKLTEPETFRAVVSTSGVTPKEVSE